jgi:hypothetical protein
MHVIQWLHPPLRTGLHSSPPLTEPQHWTDAVNAFGTVASALAAIAVAVFAYLEIRRYKRDAIARRRAADLRISDIAYALRRRVWNWNGQYPDRPGGARSPIDWAIQITPEFAMGEAQLSRLVDLLTDASPSIGIAVRSAYIKFYKGTANVEEAARVGTLPMGTMYAPMAERYAKQGQVWFAGCTLDLTKAVDRELTEIESGIVYDADRRRPELPGEGMPPEPEERGQ